MATLLPRDHARLAGVHRDLVRVVERARQMVPFIVTEGLRSRERQAKLVAIGASRTMNSRHLTGHAVDLAYWLDDGDGVWRVTRRGTRFEATQVLAMAVRQQFGHLSAGAARGLALRHDHGSGFMADHVQKQARFRGISPSCAFVGEPETNGVIERLFRTLKEQIVHGRVFQTIDEVRDAARNFAARYNAEWLVDKNRYLSPLDARAARLDTTSWRAAWCNTVSRKPGAVHRSLWRRGRQAGRIQSPPGLDPRRPPSPPG